MTQSLTLIDGSGFIFRAYHSLPPLTNPQGVPVGAVYGFVNMMLRLQEQSPSSHIAVIFDAGRQTFRNRIYAEYKAHRPPAPDDLVPQFPLVREATIAMNLPAIELADYEADDIIATYTKQARAAGMEVTIVSSDKDLMQLVGDGVHMYDAMKQKKIGVAEVTEKFGVPPEKVLDVLSLMGDSSDNIPGVPGIGPKTAAELIQTYGDLDGLLARTGEIKQPKRREALEQNADNARLSRQLASLHYEVPLPPLESLVVQALDKEKLAVFLQAQGFKSLVARLGNSFIPSPVSVHGVNSAEGSLPPAKDPSTRETLAQDKPITSDYTTLRTEAELQQWVSEARKKGIVAFDTETMGLNALEDALVGFSLCIESGKACYVPLTHKGLGAGDWGLGNTVDLFSPMPKAQSLMPNQLPLARAIALIKPLLEDASVIKVGQNIKYDMHIMAAHGVQIAPIEDTMLLAYVLHAGEHSMGMDELSSRYLGHTPMSYDSVTGTGKNRKTFDEIDIETATQYAAEDADITMRLYELFKPQVVAQKLLTLYDTIERPLINVVVAMEARGIKVDTAKLRGLSSDFTTRMAESERNIHALAGHSFNVASPKQLGEVLFDEMGIEGGKKSAKTGAYGTGNDVLEELSEAGHTIADAVIEYRQLAKLKNTYCDTLPEQVNKKTGRVHTSYALAITSTGRLSSSEPNLQNIPIRTIEGKKIREAFIAEPNCLLISADYSQIELRLLAHMADLESLKAAFRNGDDIHAITASEMFGVALSDMTPDIRRRAKAINFGIIYGISAHGLSKQLGISRSEAGAYIEQYFTRYPGIRDYMEATKAFARAHGYVETLYGRRCHVPSINDKNGARRQFSERAAINAPLQGTAADIIKRAMISVERQPSAAKMLLQVHDELIFEAPEASAPEAAAHIKTLMESAAKLSIPLVVETGIGKHWGSAH